MRVTAAAWPEAGVLHRQLEVAAGIDVNGAPGSGTVCLVDLPLEG